MKYVLKIIGLFVVGLLTAIIIYPFLHESGHLIVALMIGAEILDFNLLPLPFVVCKVSTGDNIGQMLIGLGGIMIPYIVSMSLKPKRFWIWYINLLVRGISIYAIFISIIAIVFYMNGIAWWNEDIVRVLQIFPNGIGLFLCVFVFMFICGFFSIIRRENPFYKVYKLF